MPMNKDTEYNLEMIRALDEAIAKGHWEGGLFFQAAGKKLRDLSEKLKKEFQIFLKKAEEISRASRHNEVYHLGFDLFRWL